jgi:hypothetical protein
MIQATPTRMPPINTTSFGPKRSTNQPSNRYQPGLGQHEDAEGHLDRGAIPMVFGIVSNSLMEITIYCRFISFRMLPHVCPQSCRERSAAVSAPQAP